MSNRKLFKRAEPESYAARRGITASAARLNTSDRAALQERATAANRALDQQIRAWDHFDRIGEIKFAYGLVASVMSRIRLYPAFVLDPDAPPVALTDAVTIERPDSEEDGPTTKANNGIPASAALEARDVYRKAFSKSNIPTMMRSFALNISVPGECHLAQLGGAWEIKSTSELRVEQGGVKLYSARGVQPRDLDSTTPIGRIWREHPQYSTEPDSSMFALADDCEELLLLSKVIRVVSRAKMNAGLLFVPDEIAILNKTLTDDEEIEEDEEAGFEKEILEAIRSAVESEDAATTVNPTIVRGPAEQGEKIKHILLERKADEFLIDRADRTLERILQGLDVPKDVVTGLANVKYSNAIQIDESLYKAHVEPLALMICDAITEIVYQPLLRAKWGDDAEYRDLVDRMVVWYDPSEVTTRPDRAADAQRLYDAFELSGSALRNAYGYSDADRPSEDELAFRLAMANTPPPELLMVLFQKILPTALKATGASAAAADELPDELKNALSGTEAPTDVPLDPTATPEGGA